MFSKWWDAATNLLERGGTPRRPAGESAHPCSTTDLSADLSPLQEIAYLPPEAHGRPRTLVYPELTRRGTLDLASRMTHRAR